MKPDLETLKTKIEEYLETEDFAVFHGFPRLADPASMVHWDAEGYPEYETFLAVARKLEVRLIVFHHRRLAAGFIDDALDQLDAADLSDEECAEFERRLREMRVFEGFTSAVELSFEFEGRIYFYTRRADWYEELLDVADEIADLGGGDDELDVDELDDELGGPYFSKN